MDQGKTLKVTLPTGRVVTIRETNGDDDATLSNLGNASTGENVYNFLANIMVDTPKVLAKEIKDWPINDKYVLLFKQRIFNQGHEFKFKHTDPDDRKEEEKEYTEDLIGVDGDLGDPEFKPTPNQVFLYPKGNATHIEFSIPSGDKFRFRVLTGIMEEIALLTPQADVNNNSQLLIRELEYLNGANWERLFNFRNFSSKNMVFIRAAIRTLDRTFDPYVNFKNPNTGNPFSIPLMKMPTFYFPEGTMLM